MKKNKWFLNGGRGSGKSIRLLCETYENKIVELQNKVDTLQGFLDHDIEYDMDKTIQEQKIKIAELEKKLTEKVTLESLDVVSGKITELEEAKANLEYLLEGRDNEIADLEKKNKVLAQNLEDTEIINNALEKENAELRKIAESQQSSNMNTHLENKKLKEGLAVGSTWNKYLNSMNKSLEEERDRYREMTFDMKDQLTKAKEIIREFVEWATWQGNSKCPSFKSIQDKAEAFLNSEAEK